MMGMINNPGLVHNDEMEKLYSECQINQTASRLDAFDF